MKRNNVDSGQSAQSAQADLSLFFFILVNCLQLNPVPNKPWFLCVRSKSLLKTILGKGEIARNEQFHLFLQCFLTLLENFRLFSSNLKLSFEGSKICRLGKGYYKTSVPHFMNLYHCNEVFGITYWVDALSPFFQSMALYFYINFFFFNCLYNTF